MIILKDSKKKIILSFKNIIILKFLELHIYFM